MSIRHNLLTIFLAPILLVQGKWVRHKTPILPEPDGPQSGNFGKENNSKKNSKETIKLLILGDSAAAGVGVNSQDKALMGNLLKNLSADYEVTWKLMAKTGATTRSASKEVKLLKDENFDVVVISLGVNDITANENINNWLEMQQRLFQYLFISLKAQYIIVTELPPMHRFPALPQPLRWYLGTRAVEFNRALNNKIKPHKNINFLQLNMKNDPELMANDGFHPGEEIYKKWALVASETIKAFF